MGYTYVMSDLHGQYDKYIEMLGVINLKDDDILYILGDILDRGPNPIKIILDLMKRFNVEVLAGNHEVMALECLNNFLLKEINEDSLDSIEDSTGFRMMLNWQINGSSTTLEELHALDKQTLSEVVDFISDFELAEEITVGEKDYVLVHAGLGNFSPDKAIGDYKLHELVWERPDYSRKYFEDRYLVTGHTPTALIEGAEAGKIYINENHIAVDCGCSYEGGRLGCLRLDDMKQFYV